MTVIVPETVVAAFAKQPAEALELEAARATGAEAQRQGDSPASAGGSHAKARQGCGVPFPDGITDECRPGASYGRCMAFAAEVTHRQGRRCPNRLHYTYTQTPGKAYPEFLLRCAAAAHGSVRDGMRGQGG